jgi:ATP-dependent DNA helicase RecQ
MREHKRLDALLAYCDAAQCRRAALLSYFDEECEPCGNCDNCLSPPKMIDGSQQARMLFCAISDTGEAFGAVHVIDVLCGAGGQKIITRGHEKLKSYGRGAGKPKDYWQAFIRQAVAGNYLSINIQKYGALQLTRRGRAVIEGEENFALREIVDTDIASSRSERSSSTRKGAKAAVPAGDQALLTALKACRLELAREREVPAYVIFPDATLLEMASLRPGTMKLMAQINGVGPRKLEEFGALFLRVIQNVG